MNKEERQKNIKKFFREEVGKTRFMILMEVMYY